MECFGILVSIKLVQGILELNLGQSVFVCWVNNYFGIKCGSNWEGDIVYWEDDDYDVNGQFIKSCFCFYKNSEVFYIVYFEFLCDLCKVFCYGFLFCIDLCDYECWVYGLK